MSEQQQEYGGIIINGIDCSGGGGSSVTPNPPAPATEILSSLDINGVIYGIEQETRENIFSIFDTFNKNQKYADDSSFTPDESFFFKIEDDDSSWSSTATIYNNNAYDLTNIDKLELVVEITQQTDYAYLWVTFSQTKYTWNSTTWPGLYDNVDSALQITQSGSYEIDVSSLTGSYYIYIGVTTGKDSTTHGGGCNNTHNGHITGTVTEFNIISSSSGTKIVPNPSGSATDTLEKLQIENTIYDFDAGTEVIANPTETATNTLNTISIDGTIYEIEGGGSGGGSSAFIDTSNKLQTIQVTSGDDWSYVATQDCWATINPWNSSNSTPSQIYLDNVELVAVYNSRPQYAIYIKQGQTLLIKARTDYTYGSIYGLLQGGGGSFHKKTTAEYQALPLSDKEDPDVVYFIDDSGAVTEDIDPTDWTNNYEHGNMSISVVSDKLTYDWDGGTDIGALSVITTAIPSTVDKIKFKVTTGTSYNTTHTPSVDRFKIYIGLRNTNSTTFFDPTQITWLASTNYNTANSIWENELDLSNVTDSGYLYFYAPGWDLTLDYMQLETTSGSTDNCIYYQNIKYADNASGGNVDDVYVNGQSVLDANNIAQVKTHIEKTTAAYYAIPEEIRNTDNVLYAITDDGIHLGDTFNPVIYSTEEREIGVWTDNKPLYQKTWIFTTPITVNSNSWQSSGIAVADTKIETVASCKADNTDGQIMNYISATTDLGTQTYVMLFNSRTNADMQVKYLTLQYTKTTDTAGSGSYNTLRVPMVHYDANEKIIGTWFGQTLYEKSYEINNPSSTDITVDDMSAYIDEVINFDGSFHRVISSSDKRWYPFSGRTESSSYNSYKVNSTVESGVLKIGIYGYSPSEIDKLLVTIQYTKTTD